MAVSYSLLPKLEGLRVQRNTPRRFRAVPLSSGVATRAIAPKDSGCNLFSSACGMNRPALCRMQREWRRLEAPVAWSLTKALHEFGQRVRALRNLGAVNFGVSRAVGQCGCTENRGAESE